MLEFPPLYKLSRQWVYFRNLKMLLWLFWFPSVLTVTIKGNYAFTCKVWVSWKELFEIWKTMYFEYLRLLVNDLPLKGSQSWFRIQEKWPGRQFSVCLTERFLIKIIRVRFNLLQRQEVWFCLSCLTDRSCWQIENFVTVGVNLGEKTRNFTLSPVSNACSNV